ncbi:MAG TPA: formylmethanofuran dehydrogenase subunit E family protein [Spirochaetota bacterium]|nr:formylmethanofuran dehydrogenase subunit E family protein [Spirochaetota bacterium]HPJ36295.1 formylmethanofuran dehydrogenase subunit E family protein [Spirochaetota bacterium]
MNIGPYSYEEYAKMVESFHGTLAPGLLIGGYMVDYAMKNLPEGEFFDSICETRTCLPDAVQLLTPCSVGNDWLKIFDFGKFAVTLYEKYNGEGVRVYLDVEKLKNWPEVNSWFFKLKPKKEQDSELLFSQIREAGHSVLSLQRVKVEPDKLMRKKGGSSAICPVCGEAYPAEHGDKCRSCAGESPFVSV